MPEHNDNYERQVKDLLWQLKEAQGQVKRLTITVEDLEKRESFWLSKSRRLGTEITALKEERAAAKAQKPVGKFVKAVNGYHHEVDEDDEGFPLYLHPVDIEDDIEALEAAQRRIKTNLNRLRRARRAKKKG